MKRELVTGLLTLSLLASMLPANAQAAEGMFVRLPPGRSRP